MLNVAVVIPALNEAATIGPIVAACLEIAGVGRVIVVDDGSSDATAVNAAQAGAEVVRHSSRRGKGASLALGFQAALATGARRIVTLDGDGQHRPEDIAPLLACSAAWPDAVVIGSRTGHGAGAPRARVAANRVADFWVSWAARQAIEDSQSGFRIYPAGLLGRLRGRRLAAGFAFESEILIAAGRMGLRIFTVDIPAIYAGHRASHFRPVADITCIVLMVAGKLLQRGMDPLGLWRSLRPGFRCGVKM
ncbi:MAG: glycosyltransferase family 2 protein [Pseudomonadota bacterium]|nr:glycosyltransferase family 2 protein [Pseudomonadota bacterium]